MSEKPDAKFVQLYGEYAKAIRGFDNASKDRRRVREQLAAKRSAPLGPRRPVGSPPNFRMPQAQAPQLRQPPRQRERKVYLGRILGWARIRYAPSPPLPTKPDPTAFFDSDKLYDNTSLALYRNAKGHYLKCRTAFFDYARQQTNETRRQKIKEHRERAKEELTYARHAQLLGLEPADETAITQAQMEVENACKHAWAIYQRSPSAKSDAVKVELVGALIEAQLIGLDESQIVKTIETEISRLLTSGALGMVKR